MADCLSRWAYPASKGMLDVSAHGDEAETGEAKRIIEMERLMEEEGVKCFVVMAADAPLGRRMGRAVRVLAPEGAESDKHLLPESCLQDDWTDDYSKSEAFEAEYRAVTDPDDGQKWRKGLTEEDGKLYRNGKLLVPESRVLELCEAWHHHMMHPGVRKQALDMQRRFEIDQIGLYNAIRKVRKGCSVCQACTPTTGTSREKPNRLRYLTSPWRAWPWTSFPCPNFTLARRPSLCGPVCGPPQRLRSGRSGTQKGIASQGMGSHDDLSLADRLWHPAYHLQLLRTPVYWRLVQGHMFSHGDTSCQERRLPQPVQRPG